MKCDELKRKYSDITGPYYGCNEVDEAIDELKDKIQMHDFFWEGCGFAKRRFKNTIAVSEAFDRLEAENAELKKKLIPCLNGDCILTCEVVEKYGKENAELKAEIESLKASHYAESVDAGMRERRLCRLLWHAIALFCARSCEYFSGIMSHCLMGQVDLYRRCEEKKNKYLHAMYKCRAKAEEYK